LHDVAKTILHTSKRSRAAGHVHGYTINVFFKTSVWAPKDILLVNDRNDRADNEIPITADRDRNDWLNV
jgi:hypothetical protein